MTTLYTYQMELIDLIVELSLEGSDVQAELTDMFLTNAPLSDVIESVALHYTDGEGASHLEVATEMLEKVAQNIVDCFDKDIFEGLAKEFGFNEALEIMEDGCDKLMIFHDCYDMETVAQQWLEETDADLSYILKDNEFYLDEVALLHDLRCGGDISNYYYEQAIEDAIEEGATKEEAWEIADAYEITDADEQSYLELVVECCVYDSNSDWAKRYFDYEAYGRDMEIERTFVEFDGGYIEVMY